jgi:flagellin
MGLLGTMTRLNTNIQSMRSRKSLNRVNKKIANNQLKLATGQKINRAEDNAAAYSIAAKVDSRVAGLQQSLKNIGDAKSVLNIADQSYQETTDILVELKKTVNAGGQRDYK